MPAGNTLKTEIETFERRKDELLGLGNEGKFVLIQGENVLGTWDTYQDAMQAGYSTVGLEKPFLVKQLTCIEQIHFINQCNQFDVAIFLELPSPKPAHLLSPNVAVVEIDFSMQRISGLLGRDLLSQCLLTYNGANAQVAIAF